MKANKKDIQKGAGDFSLLRQVARLEQTCHEYAVELNRLGQFEHFVRQSGFLPAPIVQLYAKAKAAAEEGKTPLDVTEFDEAAKAWARSWGEIATKPEEQPAPAEGAAAPQPGDAPNCEIPVEVALASEPAPE